jgi:hypothetical protein
MKFLKRLFRKRVHHWGPLETITRGGYPLVGHRCLNHDECYLNLRLPDGMDTIKEAGVSSGDYGRELYEAHMASMEEPITSEDRLWMNGYRRGFLAAIMEMYETGTEIHTSSKGGKT